MIPVEQDILETDPEDPGDVWDPETGVITEGA